jgi:4-hydroxy-tetrahydrodipicolinate reductase
MKVIILGNGRMGTMLELLCLKQGIPILAKLGKGQLNELNNFLNSGATVLEFSVPSAAEANIRRCIELNLPCVSGTTGWDMEATDLRATCAEKEGSVFWASNFSPLIALMNKWAQELGHVAGLALQAGFYMEEVHHIHKLDAPSGTAKTMAESFANGHGSIQNIPVQHVIPNTELAHLYAQGISEGTIQANELPVFVVREGEVIGEHSLHVNLPLETVMLQHKALSRELFAANVLVAAKWLQGRKGWFGMSDLLGLK